jgi:glucoamylase
MAGTCFDRTQQADGSFPRNSLIDGAMSRPDSFALSEIDEDAYPLRWRGRAASPGTSRSTVRCPAAADFVVNHGPAFGVERWESTLATPLHHCGGDRRTGRAASRLALAAGDRRGLRCMRPRRYDYQRNVKKWTVTTNGPYGTGRYFIRLSVTGHPDTAETYDLGNGSLPAVDQRRVIDAGFLELTRLGELPASDPDVLRSLRVVDSVIGRRPHPGRDGTGTASRPAAPRTGTATATCPIRRRVPRRAPRGSRPPRGPGTCGRFSTASGPSRICRPARLAPRGRCCGPCNPWNIRVRDGARAGLGEPGGGRVTVRFGPGDGIQSGSRTAKPAGSASPLIWAQAQYLRLVTDLGSGSLGDQPASSPTATSGTRRPGCCRSR